MNTPYVCAGCDERIDEGQYYWEFYGEEGDVFYLDEFCRDAYLIEQRRQYAADTREDEER